MSVQNFVHDKFSIMRKLYIENADYVHGFVQLFTDSNIYGVYKVKKPPALQCVDW